MKQQSVEELMNSSYRIGIDLGGTNIKIGIVDQNNEIVSKKSIKTKVERPWQEIVRDMATAVFDLIKGMGISIEECCSLGVGSPGTIDVKNGIVIYSNNFGWEDVPLKQELETYFNLPIRVSNDANCAALGEVVAGAAKGKKDVILLTLGTGVGGGVVLNGKLFEGSSPGGTELGHVTLISNGEPCTCGRMGCFEAYASATALVRESIRAVEKNPESLMGQLLLEVGEMNGEIPFKAAKAGDSVGQKVIAEYIHNLGDGIVNMVNIFRPELILISGGVCNAGDYLMKPLNDYAKENSFAGNKVVVPPIMKAILGNDAGIIGAANLGE